MMMKWIWTLQSKLIEELSNLLSVVECTQWGEVVRGVGGICDMNTLKVEDRFGSYFYHIQPMPPSRILNVTSR